MQSLLLAWSRKLPRLAIPAAANDICLINDTERMFRTTDECNYSIIDCCFKLLSSDKNDAVIHIENEHSCLCILSSAFSNCSSSTYGAIYFNGGRSFFDRVYGKYCQVVGSSAIDAFFFVKAIVSATVNRSSVFQCSYEGGGKCSNSIQIRKNVTTLFAMNCTYNYINERFGFSLGLLSNRIMQISHLFLAFNSYNENCTSIDVASTGIGIIEESSFIGNEFKKGSAIVSWKNSMNQLKCIGCIFYSNSVEHLFNIIYPGWAVLSDCYIQYNISIGPLVATINITETETERLSLPIDFIDLCSFNYSSYCSSIPRSSGQSNWKMSSGAIAGIIIGSIAIAVLIFGFVIVFIRIQTRGNDDFKKARAYEMFEVINKEYG